VLLLEQTDNENQNEERRRELFGVKEKNLKPNHQLGVERKKKIRRFEVIWKECGIAVLLMVA
jgi:hypothetical protein